MDLKIAQQAGFCYGVKRALEIVENELKTKGKKGVYILGPLIHNPQINKKLSEMGLQIIANLQDIEEGVIILPSHGVGPEIISQAQAKGLTIRDATCPHVSKAQELAQALSKDNYQVLIIGEATHSEVKGILSHTEEKGIVIEKIEDIEQINLKTKLGVVVQTTQNSENLRKIAGVLAINAKEVRIYNTICHATKERQYAAADLAREVDLMLVIGGYNSANTKRLAEICRQAGNFKTYHIESSQDMKREWMEGVKMVGITAGASTPQWLIEEVQEKIATWGEDE